MVGGIQKVKEMVLPNHSIHFQTQKLSFPLLVKNYSSPVLHLTCTSVREVIKM